MKTLVNTTLCYIEKNGCYLMLHRTKKEDDYNKDKWIGIGGKFENGESPEDCAVREIREETGLIVEHADLEYCGIVTFIDMTGVGEVSPSLPSQVAPRIAPASSDDSLRFVALSATPSPRGKAPKTPCDFPASLATDKLDSEQCERLTPPAPYTEFMHIFRARKFSGVLKNDCDEGDLEWVPLSKLKELPHWQADEIFYDFLAQNHPFYSLKAVYKNNKLIGTWLNGKPYDHFGG